MEINDGMECLLRGSESLNMPRIHIRIYSPNHQMTAYWRPVRLFTMHQFNVV